MKDARRILVVDDNDALRENLTEALELEGYAVEAVATGQAALAALDREPLPGAVLIDMLMPGMSGLELVAALRRDPRLARLKVALVSGLPPTREALPVDAVLGKPFGVSELLAVVDRLLAEAGAPAAPAAAGDYLPST
ncbi:MAG: response regulator [Anaeromyxobacteraceae bacterium]|nr:response regulator [Anaeromyxobacteraceae bacterium]